MTTRDDCTMRLEVRFKNARLYHAIVAQSIPSASTRPATVGVQRHGPIKGWCDFHGLPHQAVYDLLGLRRGPLRRFRNGKTRLRPICQRLAAILESDPEWLFPADLYAMYWPALALDLPHERMIPLSAAPSRVLELPAHQLRGVEQQELTKEINQALVSLKPREAEVLRRRFGLDNHGDGQTLRAIAGVFGVGVERIRQIETKALRKMRHPTRARRLRAFLEGVE